jgi:hypothetical protein
MVVKAIASKFTKEESKTLLDTAQKFIDDKVVGKEIKKGTKKEPTLYKTEGESIRNKELSVEKSLKEKNLKEPKPVSVDKAEKMLFTKDNKIKPSKLKDFNISKFETRDDILKFIDEVSVQFKTSIDIQKRGVQTNEATKEMAQLLQINSKDLKESLLKIKPGQTLNAETILAARELLLAAMNKMDELAVVAKNGTPEDLLKFRQHMALTSELQKIIKGVQTETGRALQQFKIPVRDKNFTARNLDDLNRDQLIMDLGGDEAIRNLAKTYLKANTSKARATLTEKVGFITKTQDALAEIFINAILSNPMTHVRNTAGNWITQGILMQERKIAGKFFSDMSQTGGVSEFEAIAKAYGRSQAASEMWAAIGRELAEGKVPQIKNQFSGSKIEVRPGKATAEHLGMKEGGLANGVDILGNILTLGRIPTKMLTVSDNYFKNLEYRSEIYALAYRETIELVQNNVVSKANAAEYLANRVVNPPEAHVKKAMEATLESTFQTKLGTRGDILDLGKGLQSLKSSSGWFTFISNYYLPFIQTPANVVGMTMERTPGLNLVLSSYRNDLSGNNGLAAQQLAKSKMATGSLFYLTVMGMTFGKPLGVDATGTSPEIGMDFKNKYNKSDMKKLLGIQSGTINIPYGEETIQINLTGNDPIAMAFRQAADLASIAQYGFKNNDQAKDYLNMLTAFTLSIGENIGSSTFMAGIGKAVNDYQNYKQQGFTTGLEKQTKSMVSAFVPTGVRQAMKLVNEDNNKIAVTIQEYITKNLYDASLPKDYDLLGDEIERFGLISFRKDDPIRREILNSGVEINKIPKSFSYQDEGLSTSIDYTSEELSFMKKRSGEYAKEYLSILFNTDEYNSEGLDNYVRQEYIKKAFSDARSAAKSDLLFNSDENSEEYVEYPEFVLDNDDLGQVTAKGAYENSLGLRTRIESEIRSNLINEIKTKNQGQPLAKPEEQYFQTIEE